MVDINKFLVTRLLTTGSWTNECLDQKYRGSEFLALYHQHFGPGRVLQLSPGSNSGHDVGQAWDTFVQTFLGGTPGVFHRDVPAWGLKFDTRGQFTKVGLLAGRDEHAPKSTVYKHKTLPVLLVTNPSWSHYAGRYLIIG